MEGRRRGRKAEEADARSSAVIPGGQPSAAALETFPTQDAPGSYTWIVNIAAVSSLPLRTGVGTEVVVQGNEVTIRITDAAGLINYSSPLVIQPGTSDAW